MRRCRGESTAVLESDTQCDLLGVSRGRVTTCPWLPHCRPSPRLPVTHASQPGASQPAILLRHFNLRMKRDTSLFSPDLTVEVSGEEAPYDTSHIYTGEIFGEKGTLTHGSVVDGRFEGFIQTHQGMYYVEPSERYLRDKDVPYHSVIYHEGDISEYTLLPVTQQACWSHDYPHKYGSEGGCADHSVFERMKKLPS
ncbi:unnamed protein product [Coregonus sp. 'balchen']|nr:unnamed protein product [Coregonus sp. 'balchen']